MTDPTKALADAARKTVRVYPSLDSGVALHELREALAAYDAAQATATPDDERRELLSRAAQFRASYAPLSAVLITAGDDGDELLLYTRGEYRNALLRLVYSFGNVTGNPPTEQVPPTDEEIEVPLDSSLLQAAKAVVDFSVYAHGNRNMLVSADWIDKLRAEVERASKGGAS